MKRSIFNIPFAASHLLTGLYTSLYSELNTDVYSFLTEEVRGKKHQIHVHV